MQRETGQAVLVDAGLDSDAAKKILRAVAALNLRLSAVIITHAHADHFGGAATIRARAGVPVYAPALEAAIVANPLLEPLYLFSGAAPIAELRHKFTLAEPCIVDGTIAAGEAVIGGVAVRAFPAPGHAPNQMMISGGGACFVADACFAPEVLAKHGIPFYVDVVRAAETLAALPALDGKYAAFVPGHGAAVEAIGPWAGQNLAHLTAIRQTVAEALAESDQAGEIARLTADRLGLSISGPVIYCLIQTTILSCLGALQTAGRAAVSVEDNRLAWRAL